MYNCIKEGYQYKRRTKEKKIIWILRFFFFKKFFPFFDWSNKIYPKELSSTKNYCVLPETQIFSSIYLCNLIMVLTFDTFKLKLFDLIDWNINGFTTSGCKDIGIETSEFVTIELNSFLLCFLYSATFKGWDLFSCLWFSTQ